MSDRSQLDSRVRFDAGETIFQEGDPGDTMYYILSGKVQILKSFVGVEQEVNVLEAGDFFGEITILKGGRRRATARATAEVELAEITRHSFEGLLSLDVEIPVRMMRSLINALDTAQTRLELALEKLSKADRQRVDEESQDRILVPQEPEALARLTLEHGSRRWDIHVREARLGRYDRVTGIMPDVDLSGMPDSASVSRLHARLVLDEEGFKLIEEVGVKNGTHVNGRRIAPNEPVLLKDGDRIGLGAVVLAFTGGAAL
jgi:CRP-like cAMP-binding protein